MSGVFCFENNIVWVNFHDFSENPLTSIVDSATMETHSGCFSSRSRMFRVECTDGCAESLEPKDRKFSGEIYRERRLSEMELLMKYRTVLRLSGLLLSAAALFSCSGCAGAGGGNGLLSEENGRGVAVAYDAIDGGYIAHAAFGAVPVEFDFEGAMISARTTVDASAFVGAFTVSDGKYNQALYHVDKESADRITDDVSSYHIATTSGDAVYTDHDGKLYFYDSAAGESAPIPSDYVVYACVSPNGDSIAYLEYDEASDAFQMYLYREGTSRKLHCEDEDDLMYPLAVPDSGEFVYAMKTREVMLEAYEALYVITASSTTELEEETAGKILLNRSQEMVMYYSDEDRAVHIARGKEELARFDIHIVFDDLLKLEGVYGTTVFEILTGYEKERCYAAVYDVDSFAGQTVFAYGDPALGGPNSYYRHLDDSMQLDSSGVHYTLYMDTFSSFTGQDEEAAQTILEDVYGIWNAGSGETYCLDTSENLYSYSVDAGLQPIDSGVRSVEHFRDGNLYYTKEDPETGAVGVYFTSGSEGECICEKVSDLYVYGDMLYLYVVREDAERTRELLAVVDGKKTRTIFTGFSTAPQIPSPLY